MSTFSYCGGLQTQVSTVDATPRLLNGWSASATEGQARLWEFAFGITHSLWI
jgi:hypothetical protein